MKLPTESYLAQKSRWPKAGRHILAQFDDESVVVYQAYRPSIGHFAVENGYFGGKDFSYSRMSWIKPNFLWMMYRSGWGQKEGQEVILAVRIRRSFFEELLSQAVPSSYTSVLYEKREDWQKAVRGSDVRLQWDPDHSPKGGKVERRAIQLGLRGEALERYGKTEVLEVMDVSEFVAEQRSFIAQPELLQTPSEAVFVPESEAVARWLGIES